MSNREKCRGCGAKLKHDKTSDQYDPEYCSGLCRKKDFSEPYVKSPEEQAAVVEVTKKVNPASLEDYKRNVPSKYARRFEPEKLNWSENEMNEEELKQAGFRANRKPIPGDWDFEEVNEVSETTENHFTTITPETEWDIMRARAKELGIQTYGKNKGQVAKEIMEKEAENAK